MILPKPIWRDIEGYEGLYQVNQLGQVRSLNYRRTNKTKRLKLKKIERGYLYIGLRKQTKVKNYLIHRLVAEAFIPNPNNFPQVNHKDENKENNCINNLEWCTNEYNHKYGTINERISKSHKESKRYKGKNNPKAKSVICITTGKIFHTATEGAEYYNCHQGNISKCCKGKYKSCGKYKGEKLVWRYLVYNHNKKYRIK